MQSFPWPCPPFCFKLVPTSRTLLLTIPKSLFDSVLLAARCLRWSLTSGMDKHTVKRHFWRWNLHQAPCQGVSHLNSFLIMYTSKWAKYSAFPRISYQKASASHVDFSSSKFPCFVLAPGEFHPTNIRLVATIEVLSRGVNYSKQTRSLLIIIRHILDQALKNFRLQRVLEDTWSCVDFVSTTLNRKPCTGVRSLDVI